jgi:hypothetical protein
MLNQLSRASDMLARTEGAVVYLLTVLVVSAGLVPMSDMPGPAVAAVVSAQTVGMCAGGYEVT